MRRAIGCVLLGITINLAVVLRYSYRYSVGIHATRIGFVLRYETQTPYVFKRSLTGATDIESRHLRSPPQRDIPALPYWSHATSFEARVSQPGWPGSELIEFSRGWPCESMYGRRIEQPGSPIRFEGAVPLVAEYKAMPLIPIWPGFAINTLFYAVLVFPLTHIPVVRTLREILCADRARRGLCPKCAYDLRNRAIDSSACPECGSAVARVSR